MSDCQPRTFGPNGELHAFQFHAKMFHEDALPALAAETLAQNAWVNFGPHHPEKLPLRDRPFAPQKAYAFPLELAKKMANSKFSEATSLKLSHEDEDYRRPREERKPKPKPEPKQAKLVSIELAGNPNHDEKGRFASSSRGAEYAVGTKGRKSRKVATQPSDLDVAKLVVSKDDPTPDARRARITDMIERTSAENRKLDLNLDDASYKNYKAATMSVLACMPDNALTRMENNGFRNVVYRKSTEGITETVAKNDPIMGAFLKAHPSATVCGYYNPGEGTLVADGVCYDANTGKPEPAEYTHAHELTHAIDGAGELTWTPAWHEAWTDELRSKKLTAYAASNVAEGFAEFGRLLYTPDLPSDNRDERLTMAKKKFPQCYGYFRDVGLLPKDAK